MGFGRSSAPAPHGRRRGTPPRDAPAERRRGTPPRRTRGGFVKRTQLLQGARPASELPLRQQALQLRDAVLRVDEEVRFDVLPRLDLLAELKQLLRG